MFLGESIPLLSFFHITYVENTGAAFSLGQNRNNFFVIVSIVMLVILFVLRHRWEKKDPHNLLLKLSLALIIGGALGNLHDRIRYGSVVDFLDFFAGAYHWPAFNVADSAICVGAFLLGFSQWKSKKS